MAQYGTAEYYKQELEEKDRQVRLMAQGLAVVIKEEKFISTEDICEYINTVSTMCNSYLFNKNQYEEKLQEEDDNG
jgi:hypothetical protein